MAIQSTLARAAVLCLVLAPGGNREGTARAFGVKPHSRKTLFPPLARGPPWALEERPARRARARERTRAPQDASRVGGSRAPPGSPFRTLWLAASVAASLWLAGAVVGGGVLPADASGEAGVASLATERFAGPSRESNDEAASAAVGANTRLIDYAVGTVNTQFYDNSGGARFNPSDFYKQWKDLKRELEADQGTPPQGDKRRNHQHPNQPGGGPLRLDTRDGTVQTLDYLIASLKDPYSKYMTREELLYELRGKHDGFLGTGAFIEVPKSSLSPPQAPAGSAGLFSSLSSPPLSSSSSSSSSSTPAAPKQRHNRDSEQTAFKETLAMERLRNKTTGRGTSSPGRLLTNTKVANLPVVTAVAPNSPAERSGLVVGDKIVAVGDGDSFLGYGRDEVERCLAAKWGYGTGLPRVSSNNNNSKNNNSVGVESNGENHRYFGVADLTIAKPVYASWSVSPEGPGGGPRERDVVVGYRSTKVGLPTRATEGLPPGKRSRTPGSAPGSEAVVFHELLTHSAPGGIFDGAPGASQGQGQREGEPDDVGPSEAPHPGVGYIRLTRFSRSSTEGFLEAVRDLEDRGAGSYVIDLRNNYGGVLQEAMLAASTLLGDPHAVLCYLLNARGGFTPVDVESYVVDPRYPGYLLSREPGEAVLRRVMEEHPSMFRTVRGTERKGPSAEDGNGSTSTGLNQKLRGGGAGTRVVVDWDPPSSYASIHEQVAKRGIHRLYYAGYGGQEENEPGGDKSPFSESRRRLLEQRSLQKDLVLLVNEGTASSAEFFVAALSDNGRTASVVGTPTFGKGLIQHTFPMPDGGGLKLTIGEFLRPSLSHVSSAYVGGGGILPDVYCGSAQGIPGNPEADLCVGVALDVLEERRSSSSSPVSSPVSPPPLPRNARAVASAIGNRAGP
ncbi:unnamed protein product [Pseudo-nitzschia multistriata]|uniref:Tail specific protease domain-containing protein n=1 Tax=Pseudo-nitzschia multistriata TaxID=183589 RepID=A0A448Z9X8_9STRA|nr:unnamed protein product [Pseudo-nitzschia multistriata]